ncbi:MAG: Rieske 2Fe-2S domain-containing protein [Dehalococcoidia bacterium]
MNNNPEYIETAALENGEIKKLEAGGRKVILARTADTYYAADARCTHLGGDLSKGRLEGHIITCPVHGSRFDLRDGSVVRWTNWPRLLSKLSKVIKSEKPLVTHKVELRDDTVLIEINHGS